MKTSNQISRLRKLSKSHYDEKFREQLGLTFADDDEYTKEQIAIHIAAQLERIADLLEDYSRTHCPQPKEES